MPKPRKEPDKNRYSGRLAAKLRSMREAAGIAPDDLATRLTKMGYKVSAPSLYAWENGNLQVQLDALPYLAKALRTTIAELMPDK